MIKRLSILALLFALALCARAETLLLRTGARIRGTIVFQNEEVVIIRDSEGARFQYPRSEVESVDADAPVEETVVQEEVQEEIKTSKRVSVSLELAGGGAYVGTEKAGGAFSVDFLVGSHHIRNLHLFIGGGLGYHGVIIGDAYYHFLPVQVAIRAPFMEQKHAPVGGFALGYGIALSKNYVGGLYAGIDFGYRCQLNPRTALSVVAFAQFLQAKIEVEERIEDVSFINKTGRNAIAYGIKFVTYF